MQRTRVEARVSSDDLSWRIKFGPLDASQVEELSAALQSQQSDDTRPTQRESQGRAAASSPSSALGGKGVKQGKYRQKLKKKNNGGGSRDGGGPDLSAAASGGGTIGNLQLPPETVVLDLLISRLEKETAALKKERLGMNGAGGAVPKAWPIRYGALEDLKRAAVDAGEYLSAAALQQQIVHLKGMLAAVAAHHQTVDQIVQQESPGDDAVERAIEQAVGQEDFLSAALLAATRASSPLLATSSELPLPVSEEVASIESGRIRQIVEGELSLASDVTAELIANGITTVAALRALTKEQLTDLPNLKRGPRVKLIAFIKK
jgi:hypothetical protein